MTDNANLALWERYEDVDPRFTKAITGKAYKGTSPSPQYVIKCLTDMFGPVGKGFGWRVLEEAFQPLGEEVLHWCRIEFWHTDRANTFEGYGQTKALMKTKSGLMSDEDAPKKSLTDAIVKAASHIGVAANIFLGRWDDSSYVDEVNREFREAEKAQVTPPRLPPPVVETQRLSEQAAPKQRDPKAVADSLIAKAQEAADRQAFERVLGIPRFDDAWGWLEMEAPAESRRVKQAVEAKRATFDAEVDTFNAAFGRDGAAPGAFQ